MPWKCHKVFGGVLTAWVLARAHSLVFGFAQTAWRILKPQQADMNNDDRTGIETESHKVRRTLKSIVGCRFFWGSFFLYWWKLGIPAYPKKGFFNRKRPNVFSWATERVSKITGEAARTPRLSTATMTPTTLPTISLTTLERINEVQLFIYTSMHNPTFKGSSVHLPLSN